MKATIRIRQVNVDYREPYIEVSAAHTDALLGSVNICRHEEATIGGEPIALFTTVDEVDYSSIMMLRGESMKHALDYQANNPGGNDTVYIFEV